MEEKLREAIVGIPDQKPGCYQQSDGTFLYETYADYRDEMDSKTAVEILQALDSREAFWEQMNEWYCDYTLNSAYP